MSKERIDVFVKCRGLDNGRKGLPKDTKKVTVSLSKNQRLCKSWYSSAIAGDKHTVRVDRLPYRPYPQYWNDHRKKDKWKVQIVVVHASQELHCNLQKKI